MMGVKISNEVWDGMGSIEVGESYPVGEIRMGKYIKGDILESMGSIDPVDYPIDEEAKFEEYGENQGQKTSTLLSQYSA